MKQKVRKSVDGYSMGEISRLAGIKNKTQIIPDKSKTIPRKRKHKLRLE